MMKRAATGAVIAALSSVAWLASPADASAKGFGGHGFAGHHPSHHHHRRGFWPYGGWLATYPDYAQPTIAFPAEPTSFLLPRCTHSVETVTVPSESGGERKVKVTRC